MGIGITMIRVKTMQEKKLTITPFQFADGVYYRLGKRLNKRELGLVLLNCKTLLGRFGEKHWEDFEVWAFVDSLIYEMRKNQLPMVFRMFYSITNTFLATNVYNEYTTETSSSYSSWIRDEISRLKKS